MSPWIVAVFSTVFGVLAGFVVGRFRARQFYAAGFIKGRESAGAKLTPRKANEIRRRAAR